MRSIVNMLQRDKNGERVRELDKQRTNRKQQKHFEENLTINKEKSNTNILDEVKKTVKSNAYDRHRSEITLDQFV